MSYRNLTANSFQFRILCFLIVHVGGTQRKASHEVYIGLEWVVRWWAKRCEPCKDERMLDVAVNTDVLGR